MKHIRSKNMMYKLSLLASAAIVVALLTCSTVIVSSQDDDSKAIKAEVFISARPEKPSRRVAKYRPITLRSTPTINTPPPGTTFAQLGLTLWRLRPAKATDKTKELIEEDDDRI